MFMKILIITQNTHIPTIYQYFKIKNSKKNIGPYQINLYTVSFSFLIFYPAYFDWLKIPTYLHKKKL